MEKNAYTRNVLVAIDVQNDFINGSLAVREGAEVVQPINEVSEAVRASKGATLFTRDWHPAVTPHFADYGGTWPTHCVADTEGAGFHPDLVIKDGDTIISKGMGQTDGYSGWEGTSDTQETLETIIAPHTPEESVRVFIGGLATDYCVKATALDMAQHFENDNRVRLYLLRDAIRAVGLRTADEMNALQAMRDAKIHALSTQEALALIDRTAS